MASWPMHRRAQWPGYRPARSGLSTPLVKKLSYRSQVFWDAKKSLCFGPLAALEPHSCDVLTIRYALNRRYQWGLPAFIYPGQAVSRNPSPFPRGQETSRDLLTIDVRDCGRSSFWPLIPEFPCVRQRHAPDRSFKRAETWVWIGRGSCRMSMEFGGTQG